MRAASARTSPFMHDVVDSVVEVMGGAYPELRDATPLVQRVIRTEEEAYAQTLGAGLQRLEQMLARAERRHA